MKFKELISSEAQVRPNLSYSPLDTMINNWLEENKGIIIHKVHYQLATSNKTVRSSVLIEYTQRHK